MEDAPVEVPPVHVPVGVIVTHPQFEVVAVYNVRDELSHKLRHQHAVAQVHLHVADRPGERDLVPDRQDELGLAVDVRFLLRRHVHSNEFLLAQPLHLTLPLVFAFAVAMITGRRFAT